jgi:Putative antitoxin
VLVLVLRGSGRGAIRQRLWPRACRGAGGGRKTGEPSSMPFRTGSSGFQNSSSPLAAITGFEPCENASFMRGSCIATKTITLEIDAYEHLRAAKRPGESFSEVVRRALFKDVPPTGDELRSWFRAGGSGVSLEYLEGVERADQDAPPPDDPWVCFWTLISSCRPNVKLAAK